MSNYLFLHAMDSLNDKQKILCYNLKTNKIEQKKIEFTNWFYIETYNSELINLLDNYSFHDIKKIKKLKNVNLSHEKRNIVKVYKIFYLEKEKESILDGFKYFKLKYYEINIVRSIRFVTSFKIRFLESITIKNNKLIKNEGLVFKIPIFLFCSNNYILKYTIDQNYNLQFCSNLNSINNEYKIVCYLRKSKLIKKSNCFDIYLDDLIINFLRISDSLHKDRIKINLEDYNYIKNNKSSNFNKKCEVMKKVFEKYFQQLLYVTKLLSIPLNMLLKIANRKMISDLIYLSYMPNNIICSIPKDLKKYHSNPLIEIFDTGGKRLLCKEDYYLYNDNNTNNKVNIEYVCLDFISMYPSIMLILFKDDIKMLPYYIVVKKMIELKLNESDPKKKHVYKIILNSIYGSLGISKEKKQFLIRSDVDKAKNICIEGKKLLTKAIDHFIVNSELEIIYCNTDSLVVRGPKDDIKILLEKWNKENEINLKIERRGERILFLNKQIRIWIKNGVIEAIGWLFNSVSVPKIIRNYLKIILCNSIKGSYNVSEFKDKFEEECKKRLKLIKNEKIKDLRSLIVAKKSKFNLDIFIKLYSSFDENCINEDYSSAIDLIGDFEDRDFRLDKRLKFYIDRLIVYVEKL